MSLSFIRWIFVLSLLNLFRSRAHCVYLCVHKQSNANFLRSKSHTNSESGKFCSIECKTNVFKKWIHTVQLSWNDDKNVAQSNRFDAVKRKKVTAVWCVHFAKVQQNSSNDWTSTPLSFPYNQLVTHRSIPLSAVNLDALSITPFYVWHPMSIDFFFLPFSISWFSHIFLPAQSTYMLCCKQTSILWYTFVQKHQMENSKLISDYTVGFICLLGHLIVHFSSSHRSITTYSLESIWARSTSISVGPIKEISYHMVLVKTTRWFSMRAIKIETFLGRTIIWFVRHIHISHFLYEWLLRFFFF